MKIILFFIITLIFIIYIENSVGNILLRINSEGNIVLNFDSLFYFMIHPLIKKDLWNIDMLDINYPFIIFISYFIYYIYNNGRKYIDRYR